MHAELLVFQQPNRGLPVAIVAKQELAEMITACGQDGRTAWIDTTIPNCTRRRRSTPARFIVTHLPDSSHPFEEFGREIEIVKNLKNAATGDHRITFWMTDANTTIWPEEGENTGTHPMAERRRSLLEREVMKMDMQTLAMMLSERHCRDHRAVKDGRTSKCRTPCGSIG